MAPLRLRGAWCSTFVGDHASRMFIKLEISLMVNSTLEMVLLLWAKKIDLVGKKIRLNK